MSVDLSEFHDVFFEECHEGLEIMESGLLDLDRGIDSESGGGEIDAIFRAAHSIKGGSAAFGFEDISGLTHVMETLLAEMRDGRRAVTPPAVDLLLESVDCLRQMVNAARDGGEADLQTTATVKQRLVEMRDIENADGCDKGTSTTDTISDSKTGPAPAAPATETPGDVTGNDASAVQPVVKRNEMANNKEPGSIRVSVDKIDRLVNMAGELVITQSMLNQIAANLEVDEYSELEYLRDGLAQLERNTREMQEIVLQIRMLPISFAFNRFPRLVHDLAAKLGKQTELKIHGENTEIDKTVLEKIGDPLVHLVRNSLDHGLETPEIRKAAGKPATGTIELNARHEGGNIIIEVIDDGAGIDKQTIRSKAVERGLLAGSEELSDEQIYNLIFEPGFSTANNVSDVSGRGVGLDVVRRNIRDLGGNASINSVAGKGSKVTIEMPLTLAILDGQLVSIGSETYIISQLSIIESLQVMPEHISSITGQSELYRFYDQYIPVIRLNELFGMQTGHMNMCEGLLVVVEYTGKRYGLFVDGLLGQQQVVIKSLEMNFRQVRGIAGATILGNGTIALIMDVPGLIERHLEQCDRQPSGIAASTM